jgi:hypothetical protein
MITPKDRRSKLAWEVFSHRAERGLLLGLESCGSGDEAFNDEFVDYVRWLLPESEYGLQVARVYAAPRLGAFELIAHFRNAIAGKMPRRAERLLLIVEGFHLLESDDRIAHLEMLRLGLRLPYVVGLVSSPKFDARERRFFDLLGSCAGPEVLSAQAS